MNAVDPRGEHDSTPAPVWLRGAAQKGDSEAQFRLGNMYVNGLSVEHNMSKAAEWYRRAAVQRHAMAQNNLGGCYPRQSLQCTMTIKLSSRGRRSRR